MKLKFEEAGIQIYQGDNIEVLKSIKSKSLDLIYCDILYNSGKVFDDYNDDLGSPQMAVEWYRPRIEEMYRCLKETGSIYIHCNWRLDSYIRILLDEIFGVPNFRNRIYRKHSDIRGFVENFDSQVDTILYYTKDVVNFTFNEVIGEKLRTVPLFENGYLEGRSFNFDYKDISYNAKRDAKHWLVPMAKLKELVDKNELILIDGRPYRKTYSVPVGNLWDEDDMLDSYSRVDTADSYDTPKPSKVLRRIIEISSNENEIVADFFMGGGRTAIEALNLGRRSLCCDISEKACDITIKNLKEIIKSN